VDRGHAYVPKMRSSRGDKHIQKELLQGTYLVANSTLSIEAINGKDGCRGTCFVMPALRHKSISTPSLANNSFISE